MPPALCRLAGPRVAALVLTLLLSAIAPFAHAAVWEYPNSSSTTLTFGGSMGPTTIVTDARIGAIHFNSSFSSGTFTVLGNSSLTFGAAGVINDSAATPIFSVADNSYGYIFFGADGASLGKAFYLIESTGELRIRTDHSIDGSLASINLAGGELKQANAADYGTMTVGAVSGSGVINFGTAALVVGNEKNTTFSGQLSGGLENGGVRNIAVTKVGSGTWTLSGNNVNLIGDTQISAGTIKIANATGSVFGVGDVTVGSAGTLTGAGSFTGALTNHGTYAPGNSPALQTLSAFTQGATGLLRMEIAGLARGTGYDALDITGAATLDGTLEVTFIDGFSAASLTGGESFNFFDWGSVSGTFAALDLPDLAAYGLTWDTSALYTSGVLGVSAAAIPEPATYAALAGLGALGLAVLRRRQK